MKQYLQKTSLRLLLVAFLLSLLPGTVIWGQGTQPPGSGSSADNPYQISTRAHLEWMADQIENNTQTFDGKFFKLQNDIDLGGTAWIPIGMEEGNSFTKYFAGTFDGDGYTISGLYFEASSSHKDYGLFGQVGKHGVIKNLGVEIAPEGIFFSNLRTIKAGGIAGDASECTIENCYVTGGRIYCDGNFPTASSHDEFYIRMGGIAGAAENTTIQNCFATIDIILEFENAVADYNLATYGISIAGITAGGDDAIITNCCYSGQLRAYAEYIDASPLCASGITGKASTVSNCLVLSRSIVASVYTNNSDPSYFPVSGNAIARDCSSFTTNYVSPETTLNEVTPVYDNGKQGTKWDNKTDSDAPLSTWIATGKWVANSDWDKCMPVLKKENKSPFQSTTKQPYVFKETTPISISTAAELADIKTNGAHLAGSYKLTSDIDLSSYNSGNWTPIGSTATPFKGTFDGDGYMIEKLNVDLAYNGAGAQAGLFGVVENGTVENLGVQFETLKTLGDYANVGGIAGEAKKTTIRNCYAVGGSIITETSFADNAGGGIIGKGSESTILNCYSICDNISLKCTYSVRGGGIAGTGTNLTVSNCYAISKIKGIHGGDAGGGSASAGGIIGSIYGIYNQPAEQSSITNCLALSKDEFDLSNSEGNPDFLPGRILGNKYNSNATLTGNYATPLMPGNWTAIGADQMDGADWNGANCTPSDPDAWDIAWDAMTITSRSITGPKLPKLKTTSGKLINGQNDIDKLLYIGIKLTTTADANGTVEVKAANGTIYNSGDYIPVNTELTITAKPNAPYETASLKVSGSDFTSGNTYIAGSDLTTKGIDLSVEATFKLAYTVTIDGAISNGSIEVKKPDATTLNSGANTVVENTELTITATPASGYQLKQLTADGAPITGNTYTVVRDVTLSAEFETKSGGDGGGSTTPTVYHTVTLPAVEGATTDPIAGKHEVEAWSSFRFYLSVDKEYDLSVPVVTTSRGETITPRSSDGAYIIKYVRQPLEIFIDGIVKNPAPVANETIATDAIKVWATKGNLHISTVTDQTVQVYNLAGLLVKQADISSGDTCWQLPSGIYIVRIDNQRYKVIL